MPQYTYVIIFILLTVIITALICYLIFHTRLSELRTRRGVEEERVAERDRLLERERANAKEMMERADRDWKLRLDRLKEEILNLNNRLLSERQESLKNSNKEQLAELLRPVKEEFESFRRSVEATRTAGEVSKEDIKKSFETTMRLFAQQQDLAIRGIREQTDRIGNDAANLIRVLRHDSKTQGDWGEMILENLLESSGLQRDIHYFIQENVKDEKGKNYRPDVIVRFPEGRAIVVDSKVSLTAYADAMEADDETTRRLKLKEHARSVRRHIDELVDKEYDKLVDDAPGLVLMFIPNDQCYFAAIEQEKDLTRYAYNKGIVIISPSNLMIALQLAYNMWQQDRQTKNVEAIVRTATELYEKVALYSESMEDIETQIRRLSDTFAKAKNQLMTGKGNIFRRIENLKELGITPKKSIKGMD